MIDFKTAFAVDRVAVGVEAETKDEVLAAAVRLLCASRGEDEAMILAKVMEREKLAATALGDGVAVPHALCSTSGGTAIAALRLAKPVEFGAPDGRPVDLVFLMAGPRDDGAAHLRLLSKLARVLHDEAFRNSARAARDAAELADLILGRD